MCRKTCRRGKKKRKFQCRDFFQLSCEEEKVSPAFSTWNLPWIQLQNFAFQMEQILCSFTVCSQLAGNRFIILWVYMSKTNGKVSLRVVFAFI